MSTTLLLSSRFFSSNVSHSLGRQLWRPSNVLFQRGALFSNTLKSSFIPSLKQTSQVSFKRLSFRNYPTWRDLTSSSKSTWNSSGSGGGNRYQQLIKPFGIFAGSSIAMYYAFPVLFQLPPLSIFNNSPQLLVYAIIAANVGVFFAWMNPRLYPMLSKHFLLQKPLRSSFSMLGSAFSHQESWHLGFNMLMLYSFGQSFAAAVGPSFFLFMYCSSALFSSFVSLAWPAIARMSFMAPSLGASGALFSLFATVAYLFPNTQLSVMFIPFPGGAWTAMWAFTGLNAAGLILRWGGMDYAAHLGGTLIGIFFGWLITQRKKAQRRRVRKRSF